MAKSVVYIDAARCRSCEKCPARQTCKFKAIVRFERIEPPFVDAHRCHGCKLCIIECPHQAIIPYG